MVRCDIDRIANVAARAVEVRVPDINDDDAVLAAASTEGLVASQRNDDANR